MTIRQPAQQNVQEPIRSLLQNPGGLFLELEADARQHFAPIWQAFYRAAYGRSVWEKP